MLLFSRSRFITGTRIDAERLLVRGVSTDTYHELMVELTVDMPRREIVSTNGQFLRGPYRFCAEVTRLLPSLAGLVVGGGVSKVIRERIGGAAGCTQLVDLLLEVLKGVEQCDEFFIERDPDFDPLLYWHDKLTGKCFAQGHTLEEKRENYIISPVVE